MSFPIRAIRFQGIGRRPEKFCDERVLSSSSIIVISSAVQA